ncbi:MAG: hypothetical protein GY935_02940 [Gammaproteobacteria bacterium]|nr:hypothetical protein [Gammaproteobacteria bacterium]
MNLGPIHPEFGVRISGIDLSLPLDDSTFAEIDDAINRYSFLLFQNQQMNDAVHLDSTRRFGDLEEEHTTYYKHGKITYIGRVGNIDEDGRLSEGRRIFSADFRIIRIGVAQARPCSIRCNCR